MIPPIKEKYVDEHFKPLMIFGYHTDRIDPTEVDITDSDGNDIISLPKDVAEKVIEINKKYMIELYKLLCTK